MLIAIVFTVIVYFFAIVLHEVAHGLAAYALGDPTAKDEGRLTLNPIPHIDPFGTVILPLILALPALAGASPVIFGWAKPVPFNPMYFKNVRRGTLIVASAGVATNLLIAVIFGVILRYIAGPAFNIPLETLESLGFILSRIVIANLVLGIFNLFPIPPLDGSKILFSILPKALEPIQLFLERFGIFLLLLFLVFTPGVLAFLVQYMFQLIVGF
ncbi:MAG: site-2 protease family protein [Candidatus Sungbacteria bacterium]|nr:site-2 protease family protein [Candidatus Sungbacteria bacterium]